MVGLDLEDFPLDHHRIEVALVFLLLPGEAALSLDVFPPDPARVYSVPDFDATELEPELRRGSPYSPDHVTGIVRMDLDRRPSYYFWVSILPLALVVMMSWAPFWIERSVEAELGLSATSVLTLIAFRLALSQITLELPYMTRLDRFIMGGTVLVFAAFVADSR
jgi:hypothetical protein